MTAQPTVKGRKLPPDDFEGDDRTPGARGHWVTCRDSAVAVDLYYATNGRVALDGRQIRAAIVPPDPDGIDVRQAAAAVLKVADLTLAVPRDWGWTMTSAHLYAAGGLVADGMYDAFPPELREQAGPAHFTHSIWASHASRATGNVRVWDALRRGKGYGRWIPAAAFRAFLESMRGRHGYAVSYVPLQHL